MKKIGMIGSQLIHTYGYGMHLNAFDLDYARKGETVPAWQLALMEENPDVQPVGGAELTHVWGGLEGVPEDMAGTFALTVADSKEAVFEACDLIMVMDEQIPSRSALIRSALEAGRPVFVDKLLSDKLAVTEELVELARAKGVQVAGWSQMGFCTELDTVTEMPAGGVAYVNFRMQPDILARYGIHVISPIQICFPGTYRNLQLIAGGDQRIAYMENEAGTKIVLGVGPQFQGGAVRVDYSVGGQSVHVDASGKVAAFRRAAQEVVGIAGGKSPKLGESALLEASRVLEMICQDVD